MEWWDRPILKEAVMQGLVASGITGITMSIMDASAVNATLLLSVFAAVSLGNILYCLWFRKEPKD